MAHVGLRNFGGILQEIHGATFVDIHAQLRTRALRQTFEVSRAGRCGVATAAVSGGNWTADSSNIAIITTALGIARLAAEQGFARTDAFRVTDVVHGAVVVILAEFSRVWRVFAARRFVTGVDRARVVVVTHFGGAWFTRARVAYIAFCAYIVVIAWHRVGCKHTTLDFVAGIVRTVVVVRTRFERSALTFSGRTHIVFRTSVSILAGQGIVGVDTTGLRTARVGGTRFPVITNQWAAWNARANTVAGVPECTSVVVGTCRPHDRRIDAPRGFGATIRRTGVAVVAVGRRSTRTYTSDTFVV